jgi:hypothetical protein
MSNCPFCNLESMPSPGDGERPTGLVCRAWRNVQWVFPAALLVLMPKCPMCVVGYVALFTGVSISIATAQWIQTLLPAVCVLSLACLALRHVIQRNAARPGDMEYPAAL